MKTSSTYIIEKMLRTTFGGLISDDHMEDDPSWMCDLDFKNRDFILSFKQIH